MCLLRAASRQEGMSVSAQLMAAAPLRRLAKPFHLDAFATAPVSVRIGARAAVSPTPRSAAQDYAFSALACGDSGPASQSRQVCSPVVRRDQFQRHGRTAIGRFLPATLNRVKVRPIDYLRMCM